jgi:integrase
MSRITQALNPAELGSLGEGEHCDGGGLYLRVTGMGGRSWIVKYQWAKKQEKMGIGSLADVGLAKARKKATAIREQARSGINPKLQREQISASARSAPLFKDFAGTILEQKIVEGLKGEKSKAKARRCINVYAKPLHSTPVNQITVDDVVNVLLPMWRTKPSAARETRRHLQTVFGAAKALNHIDRNAINPATWDDNLKHLLPKQPKGGVRGKHKSLPYDEMPDFMVELRGLTQQSAKMLEVCILTCVRTIEVVQMQWKQIDWKKGRWVIPGKVMKNELEADIPLTDTVTAILREIKEAGWDDKHVFPGLKAGTTCSNNTMLKLLKVDMERSATVHGFRSTFRTWGQNETAIEREVLEYCLHHIEGGAAELAYARGDCWEKRKVALKAWETFCNSKTRTTKGLKLVA